MSCGYARNSVNKCKSIMRCFLLIVNKDSKNINYQIVEIDLLSRFFGKLQVEFEQP